MVFWSFLGLFIVTNIFFVVLYVFKIHGPYSQLNPVKWLGNVAGVALVIGAVMMIKERLAKSVITSYSIHYTTLYDSPASHPVSQGNPLSRLLLSSYNFV